MRGVAVLTITGVLSQLVGFVYRIGLTRLAGAEILGLYQLILPVYSVLLSLTSVGLTTAVSNLSAWYQALGNQRAIYQGRGQAVKLFFLLALMPCSLLLLFSDGASVYLLGDARTQLGLILLVPCLLLTGTENLQKHYFYGTGRVYPAAITELAEQVLRSLLVLALLWRLAPDTAEKAVGTIVLGMALCEVVSALTQTVLFRVADRPAPGVCGPAGESHLLGQRGAHPPAAGPGGNGPGGGGVGLRRDLWHDAAHAPAAHGLSQRPGAGAHPQALPVFCPGTEGGHPPAGEADGGGGQSDTHYSPGPAGGAGLCHRAEPVPG